MSGTIVTLLCLLDVLTQKLLDHHGKCYQIHVLLSVIDDGESDVDISLHSVAYVIKLPTLKQLWSGRTKPLRHDVLMCVL